MRGFPRVGGAPTVVAALACAMSLAGCAMGSIGCDGAKERALNDACDAKRDPFVTSCLSAADYNKQCAEKSTGTMHYLFMELEGSQLGLAGSFKGGKTGARLVAQAMEIYQSIADDPKAPMAVKMMARKVVDEHRRPQPTQP
jgi:hypothetical protein